MAEQQRYNPNDTEATFEYLGLQPGHKITMKNGAIAEVTGNPGDGCWLLVKYVEYPEDPAKVGEDDMVFFTDVVGG